MKHFYEKNTELIEHPVNVTFDEVLAMSEIEFRQWVIDLRKTVVDLWDNKGLPPRVGYNESEIIDNMSKMISYPVHTLETTDELTGEKDVIRNTSVIGNAANQFFPSMMKTKITYSTKGNARSIYDYFSDPTLLDTFVTYASRHFKRDSFYHYSTPISLGDILDVGITLKVESAEQFIKDFPKDSDYGYFYCPVKENKTYTGFNQELHKKKNIVVDVDGKTHSIRVYKKGQKLFPIGLKAFRVSFCQYAVNWPPLSARYIYERFTKHVDTDQIILYDPSCGWGGRLLGALSAGNDRTFHYVGTDPNTDHNLPEGGTKYHAIGEFFNDKVRGNKLFDTKNSYEIFQLGSEVIGQNENFQKYKGRIDFIFTSPPYWCKEVYSDDPEQSCHAHKGYENWRDNFLRPTLETCVEYLKNDRYLAWNIADIVVDGKMYPLEQDSIDILESLGMKHTQTLKLSLAQMPGSNRMVETGEKETVTINTIFGEESTEVPVVEGKMKNYCQIKSKGKLLFLKYEPIYIFHKP